MARCARGLGLSIGSLVVIVTGLESICSRCLIHWVGDKTWGSRCGDPMVAGFRDDHYRWYVWYFKYRRGALANGETSMGV